MRPEKLSIIQEIRASLAESSFVIVADYRGMNSVQANELRKRLQGEKARLQVVKNSLFVRAIEGVAPDGLAGSASGQIAIVVGRGDLLAVSRLLKAFCQEHELPVVKMGVWEGGLLSAADIEALINLPPKPVMQATLLGLLASPMAGLAGVMKRRLESILYVLKAIEAKK